MHTVQKLKKIYGRILIFKKKIIVFTFSRSKNEDRIGILLGLIIPLIIIPVLICVLIYVRFKRNKNKGDFLEMSILPFKDLRNYSKMKNTMTGKILFLPK